LNVRWEVDLADPPFTKLYENPDSVNPFTGKSSAWYYFQMGLFWPDFPNKPAADTLYYRFTFKSDGIQTNKEGWMLDDLTLGDLLWGLESINWKEDVTIIPNPFRKEFTININNKNQVNPKFTYEVFSCLGQKLMERTVSGTKIRVEELPNLSPGIYFLRIKFDTKNYYFREIVKLE
jgi:hypothetical protein